MQMTLTSVAIQNLNETFLEMFDLYCKTWHLTVNVEKTKIVVFL